MPPRVFCRKSPQSIENKGRELGKERQESSRVRKRLEGKEIEEVEEVKGFGQGDAGAGRRWNERVINHAPPLPLFFISVDSKGS